jgi:N-methylhydantoinase B/oxoprolinase/acetone carboxylase alpha subunit
LAESGRLRIREDIELLLNSTATLSHLGDRHAFRPYGIFGGSPARSPRASSILRAMASGSIARRRAKSAATIS